MPAHVMKAIIVLAAAAAGAGRARLDGVIPAGLDDVASPAVAFTPTMAVLLDARLIGARIFLFALLADREGEGALRMLLEERLASRRLGTRGIDDR